MKMSFRKAMIPASLLLIASAAQAAVVVQVPTFTTFAGGAFDVPVHFTASEPSFPVSGYYIDLRVTRVSGEGTFELTGGTAATQSPLGLLPVFIATPGEIPPGGNFNANSDAETFAISHGTGLFGVTYAITGTGVFALNFVTEGEPSDLFNSIGAAPPVASFSGGTITVTAIPEPVGFSVAVLAIVGGLLARRRS